MKPILDFWNEVATGKAKTRIYTLYFSWLSILHAPLLFSALFIDQNIIFQHKHVLKNEYIASTFFNISDPWFWTLEILKFLIAGVLTYLMIWVLPRKLLQKSYSRELEDEYALKMMKVDYESELEKKKQKLTDKQLETVEKQTQIVAEQVKMEKTEQDLWEEEYNEFKKSRSYDDFDEIIESIYTYNGRTRATRYINGKDTVVFSMDKDILAYSDSNHIININQESGIISLTEKGKYFVKLFQLQSA